MKAKPPIAKGAIDLIEEAVHLLRRSAPDLLSIYCIGSLPFVLALLYFWADMSRSPFAQSRLSESAFGLSLLYVWMKCWQSAFAMRMLAKVAGRPATSYSWRKIFRLATAQLILQPYSFFALPAAFVAFLPFAWVYAFYQNLLVTGNGEHANTKRMIQDAWRLASLWPAQNHRLLAVLWLFYGVVFLNVGISILFLPQLLKIFGVETIFTLVGVHVLNTTYLAVTLAITYLCVNPLIKTVYVLRCFYGESLESGTDLLAELRSIDVARETV